MERASMARRCTRRPSAGMAAGHDVVHGFAGRGVVVFEQVAGRCWKRLGAARTDVGPALHESAFRGGAGGEQDRDASTAALAS